ncbi:hypothetical protein [Vulcaniibacterium gelatinicum]|uniref:hypothetical protein n=1 Tax=Vulcaniibacterium gelatinicum TaxID=2598725 RepID=UPI0011C7641D|nr:hypothetical protein [Vulcaniibacterium gelatinicum]
MPLPVIALLLAVSGLAAAQGPGEIPAHRAGDRSDDAHHPACIAPDEARNTVAPTDLSPASAACVTQGDPPAAPSLSDPAQAWEQVLAYAACSLADAEVPPQ